ncbi:MAG: hypothetical protein ACTSVI_16630 [Promethearchaeota archaeon]
MKNDNTSSSTSKKKTKKKVAKIKTVVDEKKTNEQDDAISKVAPSGDATSGDDELKDESSILKSFNVYELKCTKCKFKKKLRIIGKPRPHHLICRKCGSEMKIVKGPK